MNESKTKKQIALFLVLTFVLSWAYMIGVLVPAALRLGVDPKPEDKVAVLAMTSAVMFFPAICVALTRLITKDWTDCKLRLNLKGNAKPYLIGWFGPLVLTILGVAVYFAIFPKLFTLDNVGGKWSQLPLILVAPLLNAIPSFGEEWGWRGFLFPKMKEGHSFNRTALLVGLIWGIWHAPIIAVGHNYGKVIGSAPWGDLVLAIVGMCIFCIVASYLFCYITAKSDSVWPAVLGHACMNGCGGLGVMFLVKPEAFNTFVGPVPVGIIGGIAFIIAAVWIAIKMKKQ